MWNLEIRPNPNDPESETAYHEDVVVTDAMMYGRMRFNKERTLVARDRAGQLIRALLMRATHDGTPMLFQFLDDGIEVFGEGGGMDGKYFVGEQSAEVWTLTNHCPEPGQQ